MQPRAHTPPAADATPHEATDRDPRPPGVVALPPVWRYAIALGLTALAFAARLALDPILGERLPVFFFLIVTLLACWRLGPGPGAVPLVLGTILSCIFFINPGYPFPDTIAGWVNLSALIVAGVFGLLISHGAQRSEARRARAAAEHRAAAERLRLAQQATSIGTFEWNITEGTNHWSPEVLALFGITAEQFEHTYEGWLKRLHPDDRERAEAETRRALQTGEYDCDFRIVRPDGTVRWIHARARVDYDAQGRPVRMLGVNLDVTDRKLSEQQLSAHRDRLEDLVSERTASLQLSHDRLRHTERLAAIGTLAAGLGHDVANSLLPLRQRLEHLRSIDGLPPEALDDVLATQDLVEYLASLARGLRLFARDPDQEGPQGLTDLNAWRRDVFRFLGFSVDRPLEVHADFADALPLIPVPPHRLTQAVLNLVHNARDAILVSRGHGAAGRITISARVAEDGRHVEFAVADDGPGMTDEVRRRCLEPFYTTKTRGMGGTGMGLSLVYGTVTAAGGQVLIDSAVGNGTTVTLVLPVAPEPVRRPPRQPAHLTVADPRSYAMVRSLLASTGRDSIGAAPNGSTTSDLWITDAASATHEQAAAFLGAGRARRVIALGGDEQWARAGAELHPLAPRPGELRDLLTRDPALAAQG